MRANALNLLIDCFNDESDRGDAAALVDRSPDLRWRSPEFDR
jgi:hypothetical protein